jgi:hypothetical protein
MEFFEHGFFNEDIRKKFTQWNGSVGTGCAKFAHSVAIEPVASMQASKSAWAQT